MIGPLGGLVLEIQGRLAALYSTFFEMSSRDLIGCSVDKQLVSTPHLWEFALSFVPTGTGCIPSCALRIYLHSSTYRTVSTLL